MARLQENGEERARREIVTDWGTECYRRERLSEKSVDQHGQRFSDACARAASVRPTRKALGERSHGAIPPRTETQVLPGE